jgi:glycosyltransferase involved in cell wall biosynthesis
VHDHVFVRYKGKLYSNTFSYEILKRYIHLFSGVTFVARYREVDEDLNLPLASGEGIEFVLLESISTIQSYFGLRQQYKNLLSGLLKEHDRVIVRLPSEFGLMVSQIAQKQHKNYMVEVVGCGWDAMWNYGGVKSKIYAPFLYFKMKKAVKKASYILYVTNEFLQKRYPASFDTKTISLSDVKIEISTKILKYRLEKIELSKNKIIFGTIANVDLKYKAIDIAIKVLSKLDTNIYDFEYRVIGDGNSIELQKLAKKLHIENKVFFEGSYSNHFEVIKWLDTIDIYLQPSKTEGLPRALVEAMSRGCPVIASDVGGIPELLEKGVLFLPNQLDRFKALLSQLPLDKEKLKREAKKNYEKAQYFESNLLNKKREGFLLKMRDSL